MKNISIALILFFIFPLSPEGFAAGTKIKTEYGYRPIEHILKGHKVICRSLKKYQSRVDKVFYTYKTQVAYLKFKQDEIKCALDQQFYIHTTQKWVTAQQIISDPYIQNLFSKQTKLLSTEIKDEPIDLYIFTTKKFHNFLISHNDILVHNLEPLFASSGITSLSMSTFAESGTTLLSSGNPYFIILGIGLASGLLFYNWVTTSNNKINKARQLQSLLDEQRKKQLEHERNEVIATTGAPTPQKGPDNKDPKKNEKKNHPYGKYEDAYYHHQNSNGRKSPCPINGQKALDNSIEVKGTRQRVAIENKNFIVFQETFNNVYHGYSTNWNALHDKVKSSLIKSKMTSIRGKILC